MRVVSIRFSSLCLARTAPSTLLAAPDRFDLSCNVQVSTLTDLTLLCKTHSRLEHTLISPVRVSRLFHFGIGGARIHNPILPSNLLPIALLIRPLLLTVALQLPLESSLQRLGLALLCLLVRACRGRLCRIELQGLDAIADLCSQDLGLRHDAFEGTGGRRVWVGEGALVEGANLADVRAQLEDVAANTVDAGQEILK